MVTSKITLGFFELHIRGVHWKKAGTGAVACPYTPGGPLPALLLYQTEDSSERQGSFDVAMVASYDTNWIATAVAAGVSRPQEHPAHGALHSVGAELLQ